MKILVPSAIDSACASGSKFSWKIQESDRGMLVQVVWKPASLSGAVLHSTEKAVSKWNKQKRKSPSRLRRDAQRLERFQASKVSPTQPVQRVSPDTEHNAETPHATQTDDSDSAKDQDPCSFMIMQ